MPKADFPSYYGVIEEYTDKTESMDTSANGISNGEIIKAESKSEKKYFLDSMSIRTPKPNMNVQSFVKDGLIDDWDIFEKVLDYTFGKHLHCDPSNHPILFTEPVVGTSLNRLIKNVPFLSKRQILSKKEKNCVKSFLRSIKHRDFSWLKMQSYHRN